MFSLDVYEVYIYRISIQPLKTESDLFYYKAETEISPENSWIYKTQLTCTNFRSFIVKAAIHEDMYIGQDYWQTAPLNLSLPNTFSTFGRNSIWNDFTTIDLIFMGQPPLRRLAKF
jgi:hypothetical protein